MQLGQCRSVISSRMSLERENGMSVHLVRLGDLSVFHTTSPDLTPTIFIFLERKEALRGTKFNIDGNIT